jgi:hypothetical protein
LRLTVVLDTGPLGKMSNPKSSPENDAAAAWLQSHLDAGSRIVIPEIANYELRRELILGNKLRGLRKLDALIELVEYLPLTSDMIYEAALLGGSTPARFFDGPHSRTGRRYASRSASPVIG